MSRVLLQPPRLVALLWAAMMMGSLVALPAPASSQRRPSIVIADPSAKTLRVAVQRFRPTHAGGERASEDLRVSMERGLDSSGLFTPVDPKAFLGPTLSPPLSRGDPVICPNWRQIGADALVQAEIETTSNAIRAEFQVLDVARGCVALLHKRYRGTAADADRMGRAMADDVVAAFTGLPGVSDTEIAFVSNRSGAKEIHVMDADGGSLRAATSNRSINSFPSWAPDGESIIYTSYRHRVRPALFMLTRGRRSPGRILRSLDGKSPIYRGVFSPKGDRVAIVRSVDGNSEIFTSDPDGRALKRLTRHRAIDISPTWSPDGQRIAFVSDRTGAPQVYIMNADGSGMRRLTFKGGYNTAPSWSPDGRWIAYEARVNGQFDIWLIDPEGQTNVPLVDHPRSDEHPTFSPDGRKIAFTSTRRGKADIYAIDLNGKNLRRLTSEGDNTNPAWGPHRR